MAIPTIRAYSMPAADEITVSTLPWRLEAARAAVLVHDMQQYFVDFYPSGQEPVGTLVENISGILAAARRSDVPVFYTAQPGAMSRAERGLLFDVWGPGMSAAEKDTRIVERLAPRPGDVLLKKWRYSAFVRSPLETELRRRGRDQLVVCGVYAHVGCLMTACDAFSRDIEPFLVADGTADFTAEHHRWALSYAATRCAAVVSAGQVRRSFDEHPAVARSGARDAAGQLDA